MDVQDLVDRLKEAGVGATVVNEIVHDNAFESHTRINLMDLISFDGFGFDENYREQEKTILQPQLERLGYTDIQWGEGERDTWGPLTRTCRAYTRDGELTRFFYG
jgi:hypothetical protein